MKWDLLSCYDPESDQTEGGHVECQRCSKGSCISEIKTEINDVIYNINVNDNRNRAYRRAIYAVRNVPQRPESECDFDVWGVR